MLKPLPPNTVACPKCGKDISNDHCKCPGDQQEWNCAAHTAAHIDRDCLEKLYKKVAKDSTK